MNNKKDENVETTFTIFEIASYLAGWTMGEYGELETLAGETLQFALAQLECQHDGIIAVTHRQKNQ